MSKSFKTIWNVFTTVVIVLVVILAMLLSGVRILGLQVFAVLSGSMEPLYPTGALIYVQEIEDNRTIPDGTVITFMAGEDTIVTHRIVAAVPDEDDPTVIRYRTKGDANDVEDGTLVHYKNIIGAPVFTIPQLGYLANFIQQPPGSYLTISFGAVFVLLLFLPELLSAFLDEEGEKPSRKKSPAKRKSRVKKAGRIARDGRPLHASPSADADLFYDDYPEEYTHKEIYQAPLYPEDAYPGEFYYPEEDHALREEYYSPPDTHSHVSAGKKSKGRRRGGAHCAK